jgi:hypothetical protein
MALVTYTPDAADAQRTARVFEDAIEEAFAATNPYYATAKFIYKPMADEILACIADIASGATVNEKTADDDIAVSENRNIFTNQGAAAQVILTLPAAVAGLSYSFSVAAAFNLRVLADGTDTIRDGAEISVDGGYTESDDVGNYLTLRCLKDGEWIVAGAPRMPWDLETL